MSSALSRKMKANLAQHTNLITAGITNRVSCKLHHLLFLILLSFLKLPNGYATSGNSAQLRVDTREINVENKRQEMTTSLWNRRPDSSNTSFPDAKTEWQAIFSGLQGQEQCGRGKVNLTEKIVGGEPAELGAWPWMALLGYKPNDKPDTEPEWRGCGGTLISTRHVLTAAHCVNIFNIVRLGELNYDPNVTDGASPVDYRITEEIVHPSANRNDPKSRCRQLDYDIAILRLEKDVTFTNLIQPICLPFPPEIRNNTWVDYWAYVAGWGRTVEGGSSSTALRQVQVPVWDNEKCKSTYQGQGRIEDQHICAGLEEGGKDSCQGDSGGPLMIFHNTKFYSIGVVSWGKGCARPGLPGVYARVSHFLEWIAQTIQESLL